ncbi:argininosuccinate lyase [Candidatus Atribacteria bacterium HGW-Atribacteria-1]|nr:MAG: argininosuccinate lyase [Candidatus Atribacteria bacterium HGW-Atribacteria-1]
MEKLWGGRFKKNINKEMEEFISSLFFDKKLVKYDLLGSIAHAQMLGKCKIITKKEKDKIVGGLRQILKEVQEGKVKIITGEAEDIHSWMENKLKEKIGIVAGKLHIARSRNDQIALNERMYLKEEVLKNQGLLKDLQKSLLSSAQKNLGIIMPGYTHLQHAQPLLFSHHLMAYFYMFERDKRRMQDLYKRIDVLPLGSVALAGTSFPIDREYVASQLGFKQIAENSLDAVSDRDFILEFLSASAILMMHLSRLGEELVLWSSKEFNFIELDDSFCTGSSIMPQKKNPDAAELIRGKTGRVYGNLINLLTMMKALPLAYNHDMQEDKEPLFDTVSTLKTSLFLMSKMIKTMQVNKEKMEEGTKGDFSTATELADYLVKKGLSFREAHKLVGGMVIYCLENKKILEDLTLSELKSFHKNFNEKALEILKPQSAVDAKNSYGGTSLKRVSESIQKAKKILEEK